VCLLCYGVYPLSPYHTLTCFPNVCKNFHCNFCVIFWSSILNNNLLAILAAKMSNTHPRRTRQATSGCIRFGGNFAANQSLIQTSFCHRATYQYNSIPGIKSMPIFKARLRNWVETNIPVD
jgi:hypothetical protein